tara:strand:+ start:356 stop:1654 length:1299 start_codon:yes stop_codon:yes gene_type:complete
VNKLIFILITLVFLNNCSFNENSKIWKDKEKKLEINNKTQKVLVENKTVVTEFNKGLKLDLSLIKRNEKIFYNQNNFGSQNYKGELRKIGIYKFSKLDEINQLNFKPVFLKNGIIFFDKKGSIIRYDNKQKVIWKKNYYSKLERKLKPKLNFWVDNQNLLVTDSVAKYYSVNLNTGELNWARNNNYPFNSDIKNYKDKIFVVDYKNILRCFKIKDGSECWNLKTDNSFTVSNTKYSLIIVNDNVIFSNSIGDITAVDVETGLITWQLPTQSSSIINETFNFKISKLVSDENSIFFSNNRNEFYSIDLKTGSTNWINEINSNITPILFGNLILTVSNEGYLYVLDKTKGSILRVTDLFEDYKAKKRKNIHPVGFVVGDKNIFLTNSDGKMIIVDVEIGNVIKVEKISGGVVSEPFIFNNKLYVVRNGSILQYN